MDFGMIGKKFQNKWATWHNTINNLKRNEPSAPTHNIVIEKFCLTNFFAPRFYMLLSIIKHPQRTD